MTVTIFPLLFLAGFAILFILDNNKGNKSNECISYIKSYQYPQKLRDSLLNKYPHLAKDELENIIDGLKQYFIVCSLSRRRTVSMPSQAVDEAWHEFILFTKDYQEYCKKSFSEFLHHTPSEAIMSPLIAQQGIQTAWKLCCKIEGIYSKKPTKLPLLFSIDRDLEIPGGFIYKLNCNPEKAEYCANSIDTSLSCSSDSSFGGCSAD